MNADEPKPKPITREELRGNLYVLAYAIKQRSQELERLALTLQAMSREVEELIARDKTSDRKKR